ncbi:hypothetical protein DYB38_009224 [Aphanomyces astaci]|uniref:GTP-binding protein Parf n=1 Tax=Aphanomyces astaci TaxID=112090 RepID=A0A397CQK0_APHAT|nr:hypothetical protein DYB38_009224 [Aphanomyces astaci]
MGNEASRAVDLSPGPSSLAAPSSSGMSAPMGSIRRMDKVIRKKVRGEITYNMKLLIRGERGTGKTSLVARLQGLPIPETHVPTREIETAAINWSMKGSSEESVKCEVWDVVDVGLTSKDDSDAADAAMLDSESQGRHQVAPVDAQNVDVYQNAHGVIFLMDISNYASLEYVKHQLDVVPTHIPTLIIGTFRDLRRADGEPLKRAIFKEDVQALLYGTAKDMKNPAFRRPVEQHYFEASLSNCYGLKALHTYLSIPFLHLKVATVKQQLKLLETDLATAKLNVDTTISTQKYSHFVHTIAAGADIRTGRRHVSSTTSSSTTPSSRPASASTTTTTTATTNPTLGAGRIEGGDFDDDATSTDAEPSTPRPRDPRPPSPPTPTPLHGPAMPDMDDDDEDGGGADRGRAVRVQEDEATARNVDHVDDDDDDLPARGADDVEPEAPSPLRTEHIQVKPSHSSKSSKKKDNLPLPPPSASSPPSSSTGRPTPPPAPPSSSSASNAGKASAAGGARRRSWDKAETLEDFTVSTDMDRFYSDASSNDDDDDEVLYHDVVVRTLGQQPRVYRKQDFLYSDSSDSDDDEVEVPPDVPAYVSVQQVARQSTRPPPPSLPPPAIVVVSDKQQPPTSPPPSTRSPTKAGLQAETTPTPLNDDGDDEGMDDVTQTKPRSSDSEAKPVTRPHSKTRPVVVESDDDDKPDVVMSSSPASVTRKQESSNDSNQSDTDDSIVHATTRATSPLSPPAAASNQRPPRVVDSSDAEASPLQPDDADESGTVEDELAADSRPAPSPPHHLPRREAEPLVLSPQHGKDHAKDNEEQLSSDDDDDVFLDVILDDDNEDEDVPPLANHHPCDSPESSDSDAPDDITHPPKHFAQPPVTRTKGAQLPATPVATIPVSTTSTMPSLTVLNVMSSTPVDVVPSVITSPARSSSSSFKATTRPIKTRLHMVDSDNDLSSSPVAATSKAMLPSTSGDRLSGDHEFVVEKSSSFWSDDDDDNDEDEKVFVGNTNSPAVGRNAATTATAARPFKPTAAAAPPAATVPLNASVLAAIEQARRAALEMLPSTATISTPASFGSRGGVSDEEVALPTRKVKADQPKKKKVGASTKKTSRKSSASRMHVVASDED